MTLTYKEIADDRMHEIRRLRQIVREQESQKTKVVSLVFQWIHNFDQEFIEKTWADNKNMADHLRAKFSGLCNRNGGYGSSCAVAYFVSQLSEDNQEKLSQHIIEYIQGVLIQ